MFDQLISKFESFIGNLNPKNFNEKILDKGFEQLRMELIEADVNVSIAEKLCQNIKSEILQGTRNKSLKTEEQMAGIVYDSIVNVLGGEGLQTTWHAKKNVLLVGLQGSGKTTTTAKLAYYLQHHEKESLAMTSLDIHRPAAMDQLEQLGRDYSIPTDIIHHQKIKKIIQSVQKNTTWDITLWDSAGRLSIDDEMLKELQNIVKLIHDPQIILVLDITMGQSALDVAMAFQKTVPIQGIILSKADGDAKGGVALSLKAITNIPILFLGLGEKAHDLSIFDAKRFAKRLLGGGDIEALAEKAKMVIDEQDAKYMEDRMMQGKFTLEDYKKQIESMNKMGGLSQIMKMMPTGLQKMSSKLPDKMNFSKDVAIINSMTKKEKQYPHIIHQNRKKRIAHGSGQSLTDVNKMLRQFEKMQSGLKKFHKLQKLRPDLMKQFMQ